MTYYRANHRSPLSTHDRERLAKIVSIAGCCAFAEVARSNRFTINRVLNGAPANPATRAAITAALDKLHADLAPQAEEQQT